jgi:RsiW-degrading membrane proteinase PrsW (M82 family)
MMLGLTFSISIACLITSLIIRYFYSDDDETPENILTLLDMLIVATIATGFITLIIFISEIILN